MSINLNRAETVKAGRQQFSDADYIEGLRTGNSRVLAALYRSHYPAVLKLILANNGSEEQARDIYQEAVIVLLQNVRERDFLLTCKMQTYIYSVARRLWLKQLNKNGRTVLFREEEQNELADVVQDVDRHVERDEEIERMNKSLGELGEPCATLIKDFYVRRLSMEEISDKFGYTNAANAKSQKYKCMQRLKRFFFSKTETNAEGE